MTNDIDTSSLPNCVWGTPSDGGKFSPEVKQYGNSCVWSSEYQVMKDYGFTGSEEDVICFAAEQGWYNPESGTQAMHMGKALEAFGVPCKVYHGASVNDLLAEVMKGKKVLVTIDADELWAESVAGKALHGFLDFFGWHGANHALAVVGFDNTDPQNPMIIVTDTGTGQAAKAYPVKHFVAAWKDGLCKMVVPKNPPPHAVPFNLPIGISGAIMSVQEWVDSLKDTSIGVENICAPDQECKFNALNIDVDNMNDKVTDTMNSNPMKEGCYLHGDVMVNARLADLVEATSEGKRPVVYLDEKELVKEGFWSHFAETFKDALGGAHGKYPMLVHDFNLSAGEPKEVVLEDPYTGDKKSFPLARFLSSWNDGNNSTLIPRETVDEINMQPHSKMGEFFEYPILAENSLTKHFDISYKNAESVSDLMDTQSCGANGDSGILSQPEVVIGNLQPVVSDLGMIDSSQSVESGLDMIGCSQSVCSGFDMLSENQHNLADVGSLLKHSQLAVDDGEHFSFSGMTSVADDGLLVTPDSKDVIYFDNMLP